MLKSSRSKGRESTHVLQERNGYLKRVRGGRMHVFRVRKL